MAQINVEKKTSVWPWVVGLIVLAIIVWAIFGWWGGNDNNHLVNDNAAVDTRTPAAASSPYAASGTDRTAYANDTAAVPPATAASTSVVTPQATADAAPAGATASPGALLDNPSGYAGRQVSIAGTVEVGKVPSDRGFWIRDNGKRVFAMIEKSPGMEPAVNVNEGQQVKLTGTVQDSTDTAAVEGQVDPQAKRIIDEQPVFLLVQGNDVAVLDSGQ